LKLLGSPNGSDGGGGSSDVDSGEGEEYDEGFDDDEIPL